jgi:hypothetical protein
MKNFYLVGGLCLLLGVLLSGCSSRQNPITELNSRETQPSSTPVFSHTSTPSNTATHTITPTYPSTPTHTETPFVTPSLTSSPIASSTPTPSIPWLTVLEQAHCRYGAGKAYLHAGDLFPGDTAEIQGKNGSSTWFWIKPKQLWYNCWVAKSVVETTGDISTVPFVTTRLPMSTAGLYNPPEKVWAERDKDEVTIYWKDVWMTKDDDRGYLIETYVCQDGNMVFWAVWTDENQYTFNDDRKGCNSPSSGKLYAVEKHGYLPPVTIPWP